MFEQLIVVKQKPPNAEAAPDRLEDPVTPTERFYLRTHFTPPASSTDYQLQVGGAVERPTRLSLDDLRALGSRQLTVTMECAGNNRLSLGPLPSGEPWSAGAVGTATWTGVPLSAVLAQTGVKPEAVQILASGMDRGVPDGERDEIAYQRALPLDVARHPDTLLAFAMNGQPLTPEHGAPLRLVVPRWYGMASVKWLASLEAITEPFAGFYQASRYIYDYRDGSNAVPVSTMRVKSLITSPAEGAVVERQPVVVRGKAWSGDGAIARVEVAVNGGENWQEARLLGQQGDYGWTSWEWTWQPGIPGRHALRSRATDAAGNRQPDVPQWNLWGYGSNAVRPVVINVR